MNIERQKNFGREVADGRAVNIAFGVDAPFVPIMGICITSILKNNPAQIFTFNIFLDEINAADEKKFAKLCSQSPATQINLYFLPPDLYKNFYVEGNYSKAIFYRLAAAGKNAVAQKDFNALRKIIFELWALSGHSEDEFLTANIIKA